MGLDITAYKKLEVVEKPQLNEYGDLVNWDTEWTPGVSMEWSEEHFPGRGEGIDSEKTYSWEEEFDFRAGSYGGYNYWRSQLGLFAENKAFQELINFADNEGVIGFVVAKKLAKDFNDHYEKAQQFSKQLDSQGTYWMDSYRNWKRAFELASDGGAVQFR